MKPSSQSHFLCSISWRLGTDHQADRHLFAVKPVFSGVTACGFLVGANLSFKQKKRASPIFVSLAIHYSPMSPQIHGRSLTPKLKAPQQALLHYILKSDSDRRFPWETDEFYLKTLAVNFTPNLPELTQLQSDRPKQAQLGTAARCLAAQ